MANSIGHTPPDVHIPGPTYTGHQPERVVTDWVHSQRRDVIGDGMTRQEMEAASHGHIPGSNIKVPEVVQKAFRALLGHGGQRFKALDSDHNGKLGMKELQAPFSRRTVDPAKHPANYIYGHYTAAGNSLPSGHLTLDDIKRMANDHSIDPGLRIAMQQLAKNDGELARRYDKDHNGWLTIGELGQFLDPHPI